MYISSKLRLTSLLEFLTGIGYDVIVDILKATSPTHVVQLLANSKKKNLPRDKFWDETSSAVTIHMESAVENLPVYETLNVSTMNAVNLFVYHV